VARKTNLQRLRQSGARFSLVETSQTDRAQKRLERVGRERELGHTFGHGDEALSIGKRRGA
jgi:hypothetical protein